MGQRVLGIDLGAHSVKIAEVEVGFQKVRLNRLTLISIPPGLGSSFERSLAALSDSLGQLEGVDTVVVGVPGDRVLTRLLQIPITDPKKIGTVVGNELADDLPWELEDIVYDQYSLPSAAHKVLAAAMKRVEIKALLTQLSALHIDPRGLLVSAFSYAPLIRRIDPSGTVLVVDLGHLRTNVALVHEGRTLMGRTISRGGHQITEAFQQTFQLSYSEAESLKERAAVLAAGELTDLDPVLRQYATVTSQAIAPLVRDLHLSIGVLASSLQIRPTRVLICGGTSRLAGLESFLAVELGLPVEMLQLDAAQQLQNEDLSAEGVLQGTLALGLALSSAGRNEINLRQGEFSYRQDSSVIKDKLFTIAISLILVLAFALGSSYMSLYSLRQEEAILSQQLKRATLIVFGEAVTNPGLVSKRVKLGSKAASSGIGTKTAFDVLHDLSQGIPGPDKLKLDITRLEIKTGKTYITGTADSRSAVDDMVQTLEKNKCFSKVSAGKISDVADEKKQFSLNITTTCF
jgi:general secretion pathway protein L